MRAGRSRWKRGWVITLLAVVALYLLLLIPERPPPVPNFPDPSQFRWERDAFWAELEAQFREARALGCPALQAEIAERIAGITIALNSMDAANLPPDAPLFDQLETNLFLAAPLFAVCIDQLPEFLTLYARMRTLVKDQSTRWPIGEPATRARLYRLLYGGRAAVEEAMLQAPRDQVPPWLAGQQVPSATPSVEVQGITLHSGDILVSRGGAATSALIARGNNFPGNFSHVALALVEDGTGRVSVIESHIESGVTVSSLENYLADTKLRIMVLRLREDLTRADPVLPHRAALRARHDATNGPVAYDFTMDESDASEKFCSEVAFWAYEPLGISLWSIPSRMTSRGTSAWLASLGVRHFETQEPADLEYDPQLCVVGEWRDPETLFKDHLHNAIIDVMLEGAEDGEAIGHNWARLPLARLAKTYSVALNWGGALGPIPEGMSATTALRVQQLRSRHAAIQTRLEAAVDQFQRERGYWPPYWELVRLARERKGGL